jgi:starch synthase
MYSQRYGTLPVVRRTGGLADSVVDYTPRTLEAGTASGFVFEAASPHALMAAVRRAVAAWRQPGLWRRLQRNAMARDFGWAASARRYVALYRTMRRDTAYPSPAPALRARSSTRSRRGG